MDHSLTHLAYSAVLSARAIQSWEEYIEDLFSDPADPAQTVIHMANAGVKQTLALAHFASVQPSVTNACAPVTPTHWKFSYPKRRPQNDCR